jgi:hypothetical protein
MQLELTIIEAIASYGRDASLRHGFVFKTYGFLPKRKIGKGFQLTSRIIALVP